MLTVTDFFCGAGGSSQGLHAVPGLEVRLAANHWALAVETHAANFPGIDHDIADLSQVDFRRYPATDLLWASPECTNHSIAQGRRRQGAQPDLFGETLPDAAAERSRATMWDVPRYLEAMQMRGRPVAGGVVENVVDARRWVMWDAWMLALASLGYTTQSVYLNSMFAHARTTPWAPQSRDRIYIVFWRTDLGRAPDLPKWTRPRGECPDHGTVRALQSWKRPESPWGRYRAQYLYRCPRAECRHRIIEPEALAAATAIDWSDLGDRIGERAKPLAAKNLARIRAGLAKYGSAITLEAAGNTFERRPGALTGQTTTPTKALAVDGLIVPVEGRAGKEARPSRLPLRTQTARLETGLATPPFVVELRGGSSDHRPVSEPLATVVASGNHHGLLVPAGGTRNDSATPTSRPMRTRTTTENEALVATAPAVENCRFRMLHPAEVQAAMAFAPGYRVLGTRREQVRQTGNAVTPPAAETLGSALTEAITGEELHP